MVERKCLNRRMQEALKRGDALDVSKFRVAGGNHYELPAGFFKEDVDYCDAEREAWVWSVGKDKHTGRIYAALDGRFYQHPTYECIWLR